MRSLRRMCARHTPVPRSLKIELSEDSPGVLLYRGGFGDVWKHRYQGHDIAVKVLRVYATCDLKSISRVGCQFDSPSPTSSPGTNRILHRGSAKNSCHGRLFDIRTCYLSWE